MDEDALLQQALAMSMADEAMAVDQAAAAAAQPPSTPQSASENIQDPAYLASLLSSLPGVDLNDADIQAAIAALVRCVAWCCYRLPCICAKNTHAHPPASPHTRRPSQKTTNRRSSKTALRWNWILGQVF